MIWDFEELRTSEVINHDQVAEVFPCFCRIIEVLHSDALVSHPWNAQQSTQVVACKPLLLAMTAEMKLVIL